jgi:hypothetical protein
MAGPPADDSLAWYRLDPGRFERESRELERPWRLTKAADGRYAWEGGTISKRRQGKLAPQRSVKLIYPVGFPARFIEARLGPDLPREHWGLLGVHVNNDGSACYVNADGWTPQDTVRTALDMLEDWWWHYYWIVQRGEGGTWPAQGPAGI